MANIRWSREHVKVAAYTDQFWNAEQHAGQVGAVSKLTYKEGEREFSLIEKVIHRDEPHSFDGIYENNFADNIIQNKFIEQDKDQTLWVVETEYKFKTLLMKIMGNVMKKNFVKRTQRDMQRFKEIVESL